MEQECWYKVDHPMFKDALIDETIRLFHYLEEHAADDDEVKKPFIGYIVDESWIRKHDFAEIAKLYDAIPHLESTRFMWTDPNDTTHGFKKDKYLPHIDSTADGKRYSAGFVMPLFGADEQTETKWYRLVEGNMDFDVRYTSFAYDPERVEIREIDSAVLENRQPYILNVQQLHGVENNGGNKRVNVGWHFKQYLTWDDIKEYLNNYLYRENKIIDKYGNLEEKVKSIDLEQYQYFNTVLKLENHGMRHDSYVKVSRYRETVEYAKDYLKTKKPDLYISDGVIDDKHYIHYGELSGIILNDWVKTRNIRKLKNATLLLSDDDMNKLAKSLRDAFDRNAPFMHRDASLWNIVITDVEKFAVDFIDFDSFIRIDDYQNSLDMFYNDMFHLFKHLSGWDNQKAKEICDVNFK